MKNTIATLAISEWLLCGGEHFSGRIAFSVNDKRYEEQLEYPINRVEAKRLNQSDASYRSAGSLWKAGQKSSRFFDRDRLLEEAVVFCESHEDIGLLVDGFPGALGPRYVYYCHNNEIREEIIKIGEQFEKLYDGGSDPWRTYPQETKELEEKWDSLLRQAGLSYG